MKASSTIWVIVIILIIVGLGWWWVAKAPAPAPTDQSQTQNTTSPAANDQGIPVGGSVTWVAQGQMWVASNAHPVHTGYDGTDRTTHCATGYTGAAPLDQCAPGTSYTFTFGKAGTWDYHNHLNPSAMGSVVVQ
jgi:plastocyanin